MTRIFYADNPHPSQDKEWGDFNWEIGYKDKNTQEPVTITKAFFRKYYKMLPKDEKETNLEKIFAKYNQYSTNPYSADNDPNQSMIRSLGISHTSMSVMDIVKKGSTYWIVAPRGFRKVIIK